MILTEAHRQMAEVGFRRFSAREVAKRIGYSIGTLYNVYGSLDMLLVEVNTRTFSIWADHVERSLAKRPDDPVGTLVEAYFEFARNNANLWSAIYEHRLPEGFDLPDQDRSIRSRLTATVTTVVADQLPVGRKAQAEAVTRSLVAAVHGHCAFEIGGSYALMGGTDARADALSIARSVLSQEITSWPTR